MWHNKLPTKEQFLFSQMIIIDSMLEHMRNNLIGSRFDNLELLSNIDKAKLCMKLASQNMQEILKSEEDKSACF